MLAHAAAPVSTELVTTSVSVAGRADDAFVTASNGIKKVNDVYSLSAWLIAKHRQLSPLLLLLLGMLDGAMHGSCVGHAPPHVNESVPFGTDAHVAAATRVVGASTAVAAVSAATTRMCALARRPGIAAMSPAAAHYDDVERESEFCCDLRHSHGAGTAGSGDDDHMTTMANRRSRNGRSRCAASGHSTGYNLRLEDGDHQA